MYFSNCDTHLIKSSKKTFYFFSEADCKDTKSSFFTLRSGDRFAMNSCKGWAALGKCKDPKAKKSMLEKCPETCGFCPKAMSRCFNDNRKKDGQCDDVNNNPGCGWDGGDCCGNNVVKQHCTDCKCFVKTSECKDSEKHKSNCPRWATWACTSKKWKLWMKRECKKSCGYC